MISDCGIRAYSAAKPAYYAVGARPAEPWALRSSFSTVHKSLISRDMMTTTY